MNADSPHQQQRVSQSEQTICMEKIENLVKNYIAQHQLPSNENPILVAVSGGVDSVVLLHLLMALGYRCTVAHCNFHLRAEESDRDELFVRKLCASKNIPLFIHHFNTHYEANKRGISIEMAARELRYNWFELLRQDLNIQYIAVGHHRDDSVETLLLNLLRGTGIRGLTGITPIRDQIVRPLLSLTRQQIMEYALEHQLNFVEDSSNSDDVFLRNKIRLQLLPLMQKIWPSANESLCKMSQHLSSVEKIYRTYIHQIVNDIQECNHICISRLEQYPEGETILFEILHPLGFNSHQIKQIYESRKKHSGKVFLSPTVRLVKDRDFFVLLPLQTPHGPEFDIHTIDTLSQLPIKMKACICPKGKIDFHKDNKTLLADADKVQFPLKLRRWQQGDWFVPLGMKGRKKVSDFFSDNKFSLADKENAWILLSANGDVVWIVGYRSDNRYRITDQTERILRIETE